MTTSELLYTCMEFWSAMYKCENKHLIEWENVGNLIKLKKKRRKKYIKVIDKKKKLRYIFLAKGQKYKDTKTNYLQSLMHPFSNCKV